MIKYTITFAAIIFATSIYQTQAQCPIGLVEVYLEIETDAYGYESYWQLVSGTSNCGTNTVASGGNTLVGCNGGGDQNQSPGGYANNQTYTEGPWCLTDGGTYRLHHIDDWGDGGPHFKVLIEGFPVFEYQGTGTGNVWTFTVTTPFALDVAGEKILTPSYLPAGDLNVNAQLKNVGSSTLNTLTINYSIDNGTPVSESLNGLSFLPFTILTVNFNTPWNASVLGDHDLKVWASNLNGNADMNTANDEVQKTITIGEPIPNLIDQYLTAVPVFTTIVDASNLVSLPRDLDFHPVLTNNELWIINEGTELSGGSVVIVHDAGQANQNSEWKKDASAAHFMDLPTGIAFSENGNFSTSPGVFDANHDGGSPFTGPALWDSDLSVFGEPSGGNGSHIDMLHESSYAMGIAHQSENAFWVFDSYVHDIVLYDFQNDHGPGNDDHSDGIVHRYPELSVYRINETIPCHMDLDKPTGWLYIVDGGNQRILRLDINSGIIGGAPAATQYETLQEYKEVTGVSWDIVVPLSAGLQQPCGIAVKEDRMLVSEYATGDIIIYDISNIPAVELGRITTPSAGIMGITIGPDGKIWYVNHTTNQVMRIDGVEYTGYVDLNFDGYHVYPNLTSGLVQINLPSSEESTDIRICDESGKIVLASQLSAGIEKTTLDLSSLSSGIYFVNCINGINSFTEKIIVQR